jgi:hypothetical protein
VTGERSIRPPGASHLDILAAAIWLVAGAAGSRRMQQSRFHVRVHATVVVRLVHSILLTGESYSIYSRALWCQLLNTLGAVSIHSGLP